MPFWHSAWGTDRCKHPASLSQSCRQSSRLSCCASGCPWYMRFSFCLSCPSTSTCTWPQVGSFSVAQISYAWRNLSYRAWWSAVSKGRPSHSTSLDSLQRRCSKAWHKSLCKGQPPSLSSRLVARIDSSSYRSYHLWMFGGYYYYNEKSAQNSKYRQEWPCGSSWQWRRLWRPGYPWVKSRYFRLGMPRSPSSIFLALNFLKLVCGWVWSRSYLQTSLSSVKRKLNYNLTIFKSQIKTKGYEENIILNRRDPRFKTIIIQIL